MTVASEQFVIFLAYFKSLDKKPSEPVPASSAATALTVYSASGLFFSGYMETYVTTAQYGLDKIKEDKKDPSLLVAPILTFIQANTQTPGKLQKFPTLFIWHSKEIHRSFFFFAFVDVKMVSKTYTARELIRMRQASVSQDIYKKLFEKMRKDSDLGEIFRMPPERALPLIEEETYEPDEEQKMALEESSVRQLDGTDAEWKYRGRSQLEHGQQEPIGAPTGLSAQKDEGFQRFYKAVVSPTHVRVTAGGRIVPNTRGSSSPTGKWSREKPGVDGSFASRSSGHSTCGDTAGIPLAATMPHPAYGPFPHLFPGIFPGMHPSVTAGGHPPLAMMPWQMGIGMGMGNTLGLVHSNLPQMHQATAKKSPKISAERRESGKQVDGSISDNPDPVRVSPPEHFDHNRPFYFNGQWMMPPAGSFYPYGMASVPSFPISGLGSPNTVPPRFQMPARMQPAPVKADQKLHAHMASSSSTPSIPGRSLVPVSSIRPSDITRKQIEVLRSSLRYFEDQLQYNKHQIDEKGMETQAKMVRQHIQQFEKNLKAQLETERTHYPNYEHQADASGSTPDHNGKNSTSTTANDTKSERGSSQSSVSQSLPTHGQPGKTHKDQDAFLSRRAMALKQVKSASAPVSTKITPESSEDCEPMKRPSTLPAGAALAPPFLPRADSTVSVPDPATFRMSSTTYTEDSESVAVVTGGSADLDAPEAFTEKPYLVGHLPSDRRTEAGGMNVYIYGRDLTEDELRARHMYWGKAPHHLQKGLPKFDGKDFYPPSPVKSQSQSPTVPKPSPIVLIPSGNTEADPALTIPKAGIDPFRSLHESLLPPSCGSLGVTGRSQHAPAATSTAEPPEHTQQAPATGSTPVDHGYNEFRKALGQNVASSTDGCKDKSSDDGDDGSNILFRGRKYMTASGSKSRHDVWQRVWKRNKTSATAVPGTVSSMTAQGVLPNYAGHATASLTPAIANASISPKGPPSKLSGSEDLSTTGRVSNKKEHRLSAIHGVKESK
ncbi:hypothetical protein E4U57_002764 [Claviceps arundinis]|uniref:Uncharacterized protein n=1 Tax=Claviceps arundinis TaxID=1623583 RepID=A0ABQ7P852_9HYPO|nr:hypothetical protein E4U57_002764 [Claviceps arundinis]